MKPDISIVVPLYNEVDNVAPLHARLMEAASALGIPFEIVYVDDGSRDATFATLRTVMCTDEQALLIRFRRNFGQTAAIAAGVAQASGDIIVLMDADLQNDPADISLLLAKMHEGYDVVSGWRRDRQDPFFSRRLPSIAANWLIARLTGVPLHDLGCTLKAYRSEVIKNIALYGEMHRLIPIYASWVGARIAEVPVQHYARLHGHSKYGGWTRTFKVLLDLLTALFLGGYGTKPMYFFGWLAALLCGSGMLCGLIVLYERLGLGIYAHRNPLLLLAVFVFLLGVQSLTFGLLAEMNVRIYHESQGKPVYFIHEVVRAAPEPQR
jgi:glycosyltransferase involved in cell wall biosynthesis